MVTCSHEFTGVCADNLKTLGAGQIQRVNLVMVFKKNGAKILRVQGNFGVESKKSV